MELPPPPHDGFDTLIIANSFFGYSQAIARRLKEHGRRVLCVEDRPSMDTLTKAAIRLDPRVMQHRSNAYFQAVLDHVADQPIRDVLVIRGEALSPRMTEKMRQRLKNARFTLYYWDSFRNMGPWSRDYCELFDRSLSFDIVDTAADRRYQYRPLFYIDDYLLPPKAPKETGEKKLLFVGTLHTDRVTVLSQLRSHLPSNAVLETQLYLRSKLAFSIQRLLDGRLRNEDQFHYFSVAKKAPEIAELMNRADAIVDIERTVQTGYTIRTLEVLAAQRKLISTNPMLKSADFYDARNILVVDREDPKIDPAFLDAPFAPNTPEILQTYSLAAWLGDVLPGYSET